MAVPARKTSKNAKRSRRGGQGGLKTPAIHMNENGVYVRNHHVWLMVHTRVSKLFHLSN